MNDRFYLEAVRPYSYLAAGLLFLSYIIGLWFTLRTHAAVIWNTEVEEKKHEETHGLITIHGTPRHSAAGGSVSESTAVDIRDSHLYKRILGQSLRQVGLQPRPNEQTRHSSLNVPSLSHHADTAAPAAGPHLVPPKSSGSGAYSVETVGAGPSVHIPGLSESENNTLVHQVAEIAATAATVAARDARLPRHLSTHGASFSATAVHPSISSNRPAAHRAATLVDAEDMGDSGAAHAGGGHDAPNWSRLKSSIILMGATVLYAIIAEILVDTVDVVLQNFAIDEKFLGITLFALVPNTTEFLVSRPRILSDMRLLTQPVGAQRYHVSKPRSLASACHHPLAFQSLGPRTAFALYTTISSGLTVHAIKSMTTAATTAQRFSSYIISLSEADATFLDRTLSLSP